MRGVPTKPLTGCLSIVRRRALSTGAYWTSPLLGLQAIKVCSHLVTVMLGHSPVHGVSLFILAQRLGLRNKLAQNLLVANTRARLRQGMACLGLHVEDGQSGGWTHRKASTHLVLRAGCRRGLSFFCMWLFTEPAWAFSE